MFKFLSMLAINIDILIEDGDYTHDEVEYKLTYGVYGITKVEDDTTVIVLVNGG